MTLAIISFLVGFVAGFLVHRRHASKAATLEAKGKTILDALKGK
jgi:F0F1-type ATP synthase assembly protein I